VLDALQEICGTGFLISSSGYFLTCAHLVEIYPSAIYSAALNPLNLEVLTPINFLSGSIRNDVIIGQLKNPADAPVLLASECCSDKNAPIHSIGYVGGTFREPNGELNFRAREADKVCGTFIGYSESYTIAAGARFSEKNFPAVLSQPALPSGFSGAPVFDRSNRVIALHSNTNSDAQLTARFNNAKPFAASVSAEVLWQLIDHVGVFS
jgi:Trypsin-like peptidase domain